MTGGCVTRRGLLGLAGAAVAIGFAGRAAAAQADSCLDMAKLPASQKSMRRSLGFQEASADPKKRCGTCSFFKAAGTGCGTCVLLSGGAVRPTSVCNSWAAKG